MNAKDIVAARGGRWQTSYGICACPVCQPEMRNDQMSLSISDKGGRLLMTCHKGNCAYVDILRGLGVSTNKPVQLPEKEAFERRAALERKAMRGQERALKIWQQTQSRRHMYLARKGFSHLRAATISAMELASIIRMPTPLEHLKGTSWLLVVPMRNVANKLQFLEFITENGEKCFLPNGKLNGSACWMGKEGPVVVCEGVGTGLSLRRSAARQKLPIRVACAGSALNMKSLQEVANYVMADNDPSKTCERTGKEIGRTGERVAIELGKPYALPATVGMDFNDLEVSDPEQAALLLSQLLSAAPSPVVRQTK